MFKDGMFAGTETGYYENGNIKYVLKTDNGELSGNQLEYNSDGTPKTENMHGTLTLYYESGAKMADVPFVHGVQNGLVKTYFEENGAKPFCTP